jgi:aminoglycoside phosphotransferase (APT) family kinase protein
MTEPFQAELHAWLADRLGDPGPFRLQPISGGHSNETSLLRGATGQWILRRPPATRISAGANDLGREHRILGVLAQQDVPAPRAIAYASPGELGSRAALVMQLCDGHPLTDAWPTGWPTGVTIADAGGAAIDALAALHRVNVEAAGLADFGRPARYLERQVTRWRGQYEQNRVRKLPHIDELGDWLEANRPDDVLPAILHGDFRLDNCLFVAGPPTRVTAIIDWELATIGDPLLDLGLLLGFWGDQRTRPIAMPTVQALTRDAGAPGRRELADRYTELTGRATDALPFYMVLAFFKLAVIVEGAYARFLRGADDSPWARSLGEDVPRLLEDAAEFREWHE